MCDESYLESLREKHLELDIKIREEEGRPYPNMVAIRDMKKRKLLLKEKVTRLEHERVVSAEVAAE